MDKYAKKILKDSTVIGIFAFVAVVILVSCGIPKIFHDIRETAVNAVLSRLDSAFNPDFHDEEYILPTIANLTYLSAKIPSYCVSHP
ncbi:MAG: hypothetical protein II931_05140 [Clostridia bacterium]|nr:hypothetical protein [Clostridia bacterium]